MKNLDLVRWPILILIAPLKGGLPSREPQILKTLILFVCLSVCSDFRRDLPSGICAGFKRRYSSVYFSGVQNRTRRFDNEPTAGLCRGVQKFSMFFRFLFNQNALALMASSAKSR